MPNPSTPIPMVNLTEEYRQLKTEIDQAVSDVLASSYFINGPQVKAFEQECSSYLDAQHALSCASGTDALHLALRALDIKEGDEVITPAFTFAATAEAIRYVGATPVFVDIDHDTLNLDVNRCSDAITDKTRAIIAVHLFGLPANMDALSALCKNHSLYLVEDCAQSFGAKDKGRPTGSIGDIGCFSFFPSKNLGCYGDGGLITTNNDELAERINKLRNHGSLKRYYHDVVGFNSRLDEIQAAILRVKLKRIDDANQNRIQTANRYTEVLNSLGLHCPQDPDSQHVYHQYTLLGEHRDQIQQALNDQQIACAIYYPLGLHQQKAFATHARFAPLPLTESACAQCLSLPMSPYVTEEEIDRITGTIKKSL